MFDSHEDYEFEVVGQKTYSGKVTVVYKTEVNEMKVKFGSAEEANCPYLEELEGCQVELTDPDSEISLVFTSAPAWRYVIKTSEVELISLYDEASQSIIRTNIYTDSSVSETNVWDLEEEQKKYLE